MEEKKAEIKALIELIDNENTLNYIRDLALYCYLSERPSQSQE